jgi:uncharacterized protein (TIGR00730 family)
MIDTAMEVSGNGLGRGEAKILARSMRELVHSFRIFAPYRHRRKVSLFGSARERRGSPLYALALEFARRLGEAGYMVVTGAGPGVMEAGNQGAGRETSFGVGIQLPFESGANGAIAGDPKLALFNYFFTRKLTFVKEADALVFLPGGFGTLDECFEILTLIQTGKSDLKPLVMLEPPGGGYWSAWYDFVHRQLLARGYVSEDDLKLFRICTHPQAALREITNFYRAFHSMRYVGETTVIRLTRSLLPSQVEALNRRYASLLEAGRIELGGALPAEANEPDLAALPRLRLNFNRRDFGRLRLLLDDLNRAAGEPVAAPSPAACIASLEQD